MPLARAKSAVLALLAGVDMVLFSHRREAQQEVFDAVRKAVESGRISQERIDQSLARVTALKRRFPLDDPPGLEIVGSKEHRSLARDAARAGTVLIKRGAALPISSSAERISLIEFSSQVHADGRAEQVRVTSFAAAAEPRQPHHRSGGGFRFQSGKPCLAPWPRRTSSSWSRETRTCSRRNCGCAQLICDRAQAAIVICARNPYDAGYDLQRG